MILLICFLVLFQISPVAPTREILHCHFYHRWANPDPNVEHLQDFHENSKHSFESLVEFTWTKISSRAAYYNFSKFSLWPKDVIVPVVIKLSTACIAVHIKQPRNYPIYPFYDYKDFTMFVFYAGKPSATFFFWVEKHFKFAYDFWDWWPSRIIVVDWWDTKLIYFDPGANHISNQVVPIHNVAIYTLYFQPFDYPRYNHNAKTVALMEKPMVKNCLLYKELRILNTLPNVHCNYYQFDLEILQSQLNFTLLERKGNWDWLKIFLLTIPIGNYSDFEKFVEQMFLTNPAQLVPIVFYCRHQLVFPVTWTVWLTPFQYPVWVGLCVSCILLASSPILGTHWNWSRTMFEMYFIISHLLRQPSRDI
ncbi:hypothetical protein Fcan01_11524 [Folsomia candida]|uniref:Uncharacterized protein n=1 Tax=Folsomia candida TaxID=158441 RepID=A0A226EE67_FOLCA|nr:hypothetical protein Fcan01_11524 [Folsomia candida]